MKTELLYTTFNRRRFAEASMLALTKTNWELVERVVAYDDGSTDGTRSLLEAWCRSLPVPFELRDTKLGSPIAVMMDYLKSSTYPLFAKIDSDVILPSDWLDRSLVVMRSNPNLDLLGLEPTWSRTPSPHRALAGAIHQLDSREIEGNVLGFTHCSAIGGVGLLRRACFTEKNPIRPYAIYGGFTTWQQEHKEVAKGWIAPAIRMFLLDRLPIEPWLSLSKEYISKGWMRPWTNYDLANHFLWDWWDLDVVSHPEISSELAI